MIGSISGPGGKGVLVTDGKKFVLMNHTNMQGHHFGCARVMRLIEDGLTSRGGRIIGRLDGKMDWRTAPWALELLADCDSIVINGEGTLHHGRKKASWLMEVANHPVTRDKELSLINALYQENPDSWAPLLRRFRHLYARDHRSAALMSLHAGRPVPHLGDLSTSAGAVPSASKRQGIMVGDSVRNSATADLARLAQDLARRETTRLVPLTISMREENPYRPWVPRMFRRYTVALRQALMLRRFPIMGYLPSEGAYIEALCQSRLSVTGRFHGICLNLVTSTPFIAVASNSWKIEALFEDAGIDPRRLIAQQDLTPELILDQDWSFSETERARISQFLAESVDAARRMFDAICG